MSEQVRACLEGCDRVLVKGSRAMRMERIVQQLVSQGADPDAREEKRTRSQH